MAIFKQTFMPLPMLDEDSEMSQNTLDFLERVRGHEKKYRVVVRACVDSRKKRRALMDTAHIKLSEFTNNAVAIGEHYYETSSEDIEDTLFSLTSAVIEKYG
ncbi:hypothetical protein EhV299 [Emiliania huxleyi virus 86]|uniref:Uncharacterized protein n=2 Tax=root TaxID=1 RepID=Q4A2I1_EHV8U|nr:hypothetical protein EhV299 [Emiliania huxleyi virus 86]AEO97752.1 hypothetical protein ENVG_00218 [Emiliania huxleyi virus 84]AEP15229.1 hypothetical protein EOVG_00292 [Emiliania huxleyi virus 88]UKZ11324.1 hypothetical protein EhVM1_000309 [Emiliania huxleyi virus M1]CAZ69630.1 hypothetical protein [Emiliania huxleyi virus 99B1]CAI65725.1 hypothetical protein EhV299 [Emiliania huxleyi virus 86]|mmetsp:Transcript_16738/g.48467  ORF Transcript_16738/g.48467 Transcript_16738/m.48467 type:complete len:102 (-) Transcript_16738:124-429(-)